MDMLHATYLLACYESVSKDFLMRLSCRSNAKVKN